MSAKHSAGESRRTGVENLAGKSFHWYERLCDDEATPALPPVPAPDEPAERRESHPAASAAAPGVEPLPRLRRWCYRSLPQIIAALALGFVLGLESDRLQVLAAWQEEGSFTSFPQFSRERMQQVKPGMTKAEVRNLLGLPCARYGGGGCRWRYTVPAHPKGEGVYYFAAVVFDATTDTVLHTVERDWKRYNIWEGWYDHLSRPVGILELRTWGQPPLRLTPDDPIPHAILVASPDANPADVVTEVQATEQKLRAAGVEVHVFCPEGSVRVPGAYRRCPELLEFAEGYFPLPKACDLIVYERGILYRSEPATLSPRPEDRVDDEAWLIRHLARRPDSQ